MGYKKMVADGKDIIAFLPRLGNIPYFLRQYKRKKGIKFKDATREEYLKLKRDTSRKTQDSSCRQKILI